MSIERSPKVIFQDLIITHAVSYKGLDIRARRSVIKPIGHSMEPKIFWGIKRYQGLKGDKK